ncbi:DMT family transporter [Idiomarina xiamenensis]|uniref:DMT family transporter n=1 Tax=Idiomarina xiamenensis TaxID=1207041 RepID=UPI0012EB033C|nr:DMT family transporter [Idiomarina xiamenensis]
MVKNQRQALTLGLLAVLLWATVATAFKLALRHMQPLQLLFIASLTTVLVIACVISWQQRWRETWQTFSRHYWRYLGFGLLNPFCYYWVLFAAYDQLPAQQAQAINYSWAITMSLLAVPILGQRIGKRELLSLLVAYAGVCLIATGGQWDWQQTNLSGIGLALLSTLLWAAYWLLNTRNNDAPTVALFWGFLAGLPWIILVLLWQQPSWQFGVGGLTAAIYVGLFEMGVTFLLWLNAMRRAERSSQISALIFLSPFLSLVLIYFILHEPIAMTTLLGLCLICLGLVLQRRAQV